MLENFAMFEAGSAFNSEVLWILLYLGAVTSRAVQEGLYLSISSGF
jgi:hypothetical protein